MRTTPITFEYAHHVASRMREWDKREIYATRWNEDPVELAHDCASYGHFGWVAWGDEEPVAILGAVPMHPGCWSVFMFATNNFRHISFSLTKFVKRVMIPALADTGARRAQCLSMEGHEDAQKWLRLLGATPEEPMLDFGKNGETFIPFVWRRENVAV